MKKNVLLLIALFSAQIVLAVEKGPFYPMKVLTMAMNVTESMPGYFSAPRFSDTPNSTPIANAFSSSMSREISAFPKKFNYLNPVPVTKKKDKEVTSSYIKSSDSDNYNFVFYVGHGLDYKIAPNEAGYMDLTTKKRFGGKTYWVWLYSCRFFAKASSGDAKINKLFNGVHSILGFATDVSAENESIEVPKEFAKQWVTNGKTIWDSFKLAVQHQLHDTGNTAGSAEYLKVNITEVNVPAIAYRYGFIDGVIHAPANEKYNSIIHGPVFNTDVYNNDASHLIVKKQVYTGSTY